jgi:hypothetical protein
VSKDDLTQLVWRGAFIDETALRVGISAVRKALGNGGDRYIATVAGRGYCFVHDVETTAAKPAPEPPHFERLRPQRLPAQIARVVGRDEVIAALAAEATRHRLLSLVGPGGIGKTTVAIAVADRLSTAFDAVAFVDLAPIENGTQMSAAAAAALGLNLRLQENPVDEIAVAVEDRLVLIVLDNCEHLVDLAAAFIEALLGSAQGVTILATSRERLRALGEWVHQLSPLEAPPESFTLSAEEVRCYPAVEVFEERAALAPILLPWPRRGPSAPAPKQAIVIANDRVCKYPSPDRANRASADRSASRGLHPRPFFRTREPRRRARSASSRIPSL